MSMKPVTPGMRAVFRLVRDGGGWWSAHEVAEALPPEALTKTRVVEGVSRQLTALEHRGAVAQTWSGGRRVYGVTSTCTPPDGETLVPSDELPVAAAWPGCVAATVAGSVERGAHHAF
ncbi:MAG: hypothetical protein QM702_04325 [Rubrivivax sp.]